MQQFGIQMVFTHFFAIANHAGRALHGAHMGTRADLAGTAHDIQLVRVFDQSHFVEQRTGIALLSGAQHTKTGAATHLTQPAFNLFSQSLVGGERKPDALAVFQQTRQTCVDFITGESLLHCQFGLGRFGAETVARPNLALQVFGLAEQHAFAVAGQHQTGIGLAEAGEVVKVAVVAIQILGIAVAVQLWGRGDDGDTASAQLGGQACAALGIN